MWRDSDEICLKCQVCFITIAPLDLLYISFWKHWIVGTTPLSSLVWPFHHSEKIFNIESYRIFTAHKSNMARLHKIGIDRLSSKHFIYSVTKQTTCQSLPKHNHMPFTFNKVLLKTLTFQAVLSYNILCQWIKTQMVTKSILSKYIALSIFK